MRGDVWYYGTAPKPLDGVPNTVVVTTDGSTTTVTKTYDNGDVQITKYGGSGSSGTSSSSSSTSDSSSNDTTPPNLAPGIQIGGMGGNYAE
jgi:hypothetical protein